MSYAIYYPAGECDNLPDHIPEVCAGEDTEQARVSSVALIHKSVIASIKTDPSVAAAWLAAIQLKKVYIIPETQGSYDGGTPVKGTGYGRLKEKIISFDGVVTYKDPAYKANGPFYNALAKSNSWHIAFCTETQIHVSDTPATFAPKNEVVDDVTGEVVWTIEASFNQPGVLAPFDIPAGIFEPIFDYVP